VSITQNGNAVAVLAEGTGAQEPTYSINWGDGSNELSESSGQHAYQSIGVYQLCVLYEDASDPACSSTLCEDIVISSVGVDEFGELSSLNVWPNPASDFLFVQYTLPVDCEVQFRLLDAAGRPVMTPVIANGRVQQVTIETDKLSRGVYLLECTTEIGSRVIRLIK
jgi:hypothetical protein